jgi:hypothetical protein
VAVTIAASIALAACSTDGAKLATAGPDCGSQQPRQPPGGKVVECLSRAFADGTVAQGQIVFSTIEGDPIPVTYRVRDRGIVEVSADYTHDRYGSEGVKNYRCATAVWLDSMRFAGCKAT